MSTVANVVKTLEDAKVMDISIVVVASAGDPAPLQYLAPYAVVLWVNISGITACTLLLCMTTFTSTPSPIVKFPCCYAVRQREAFPGDIFNLHSVYWRGQLNLTAI